VVAVLVYYNSNVVKRWVFGYADTMPHLAHIALVVRDYDEAIAFYVGKLGFTLAADEYQPEQDKRWVLVRPPGAPDSATTILLARATTPEQEAFVGNQAGGRVFLFLATDDFDRDHAAFTSAGVEWIRPPAVQPYGKVAVFADLYGNLWDLVEFSA
jgi:catechol 2,3-dioxygenase-like lactoylglutathione lyase family enzyme